MSNASLPLFKGVEYMIVLTNKMELVYVPALVNECTICCTYKDWPNGMSETWVLLSDVVIICLIFRWARFT